MQYVLENETLQIIVESHGAEISSVIDKKTGTQRIWQADPAAWKRHAPVLFPLVGKYKNNESVYAGKTYTLTQHGFARDMEFGLVEQTGTTVTLQLTANAQTKEHYPFDFVLFCRYALEDNQVKVTWQVENTGEETMHFSIGAHPAFVYPGAESLSGVQIVFEKKCTCEKDNKQDGTEQVTQVCYHLLNSEGLMEPQIYALPLDKHAFTVQKDTFDKDALVVEEFGACQVSLVKDGKRFVSVDFDTPVFGLWSPVGKNVPFICIEPWFGRTDACDFKGDLTQRAYANTVSPKNIWKNGYTMIFA